MLSRTRLKALERAAERDDWSAAGDEYLEIAVHAEGPAELFAVESMAPAILLRDSEQLVEIVAQLLVSVSTQRVLLASAEAQSLCNKPADQNSFGASSPGRLELRPKE